MVQLQEIIPAEDANFLWKSKLQIQNTVWPEMFTLQYVFFQELISALHYILFTANSFSAEI